MRMPGCSTSESFGGDSPVIVVINKIDQNVSYDVNRKFLRDKYDGIFAFVRISCSTGDGIVELISTINDSFQRTHS